MLERLKEQERLLVEQERLSEEEVPTYLILILHHHGHDYFRYQKAQHPEIRRRRSI
jgi:hypothetical protein